MRLALAQIEQETNTFNPAPTTLKDFQDFGLYEGRTILEKLRGVGTIGGYLRASDQSSYRVETVPIIRAWASAGGRLTEEALAYFEDRLRRGLVAARRVDGLAIHLHGGCAAANTDDVAGRLLAVCRQLLGSQTPIVVTLDHHANITQQMVDNSDVLVGYRTQPHDPLETAEASTKLLLQLVAGEIQPTVAWRKLRMISHQEQYLTSKGPMKVWFDRARALEADPRILSISNFPMQPWLDVQEGGWSTVVVTDGDQALAEQVADELAELAWSMRAEFQERESMPADVVVTAADEAPRGLVVISDTGDSVLGGAAGDSTVLLDACMRACPAMRVLIPMVDPSAVARLAEAGEGSSISVTLGGSISSFFEPLLVSGVVRRVADGRIEANALSQREIDMGPTVVFDVGPVTLLVSERRGLGGVHPAVYRAFGIEPTEYKAVVLKTASNFQYFAPIASEVIRADTPGPTQSNIVDLHWRRLPRPIFPLDRIYDWEGRRGYSRESEPA
jgi:microcystin degradation protein MlrC